MAMDMTTALTIKANVVGQSQIGGLEKGLGRVTGQTNKATTAMGRLRGAASGALTAMRSFLPVLGVAGIAAFAKSNLDAADSLSKLSQRTGITVPALDRFRQAANLSDTSIQSLERAFPALTKNMDMAAQKGKGPAFEAFQRLGVSVKNADGSLRSADAVMLDIADRFNNMADGSEKAALASAVFGTRIGSELIPMLNLGGDTMRNFTTVMTQEFADDAAKFNDKLTEMAERLKQTGTNILKNLLPHIERLLDVVDGLLNLFGSLPGPLQAIIVSVTALGAAFAILSPVITGVVAIFKGIAALKIGATIAGYLPAILGLIGGLKSLGLAILGVFSGPVGWAALLIGAGAAIFAFRDQIGEFLGGLLQPFKDVFTSIGEAIKAPFQAAFSFIKGVINNVLQGVASRINAAIGLLNKIIRGANRLPKVNIPLIPKVQIPQFAKGGVVNGAQLAVVGEAGPEYIVPAGKAQGFAKNILSGVRGPGAIPRFAEGGFVAPSANVSIQTGPVTQMNGQNFVTTQDMTAAVRAGVEQTLSLISQDDLIRAGLAI